MSYKPLEITIHPKHILKCSDCGAEFDHKELEGKLGWVVWDLRKGKKIKGTDCSRCGKVWEGADIPSSQGFYYLVVLSEDLDDNGDFGWENAFPLADGDFEYI